MPGRAVVLRRVLVVGLSALLASCAAPYRDSGRDAPPDGTVDNLAPVEERIDVSGVLVRLAGHLVKTRPELQAARTRARISFETWGDVGSRIELAWLLDRPGTGFQNRSKSRSLLAEYLQQPGTDPGFAALAQVLADQMARRSTRSGNVAVLRQQLDSARAESEVLRTQVATLQDLLETLRQQFEELKAIERNVN